MHRVVQYSDYALSQFFAVAERQPWFKDTLFIVTADHTSDNYDANFSRVLSRHQIPILLYAADIKPQTVRDLAQQIDIPATVIDYLNLPEQSALLPFGQSLLQPSREGRGFFQDQDAYWLLSGSRFVTMNKHDHAIEFGFLPSSFEGVESAAVSDEVLEAQLKAMVQVYANATIENRYYSSNGRD
jgi:phosphoglycerol transferase MdoB-like AlkP superfamily enzyme